MTLKFQTHSEESERHTVAETNYYCSGATLCTYTCIYSWPEYPLMVLRCTPDLSHSRNSGLYYITCPSPRGSYCHHRSVSPLPIFPVIKIFYYVHSADTSATLDPFFTFLLNPQRRTCIFKVGCTANLLRLSSSVVQKAQMDKYLCKICTCTHPGHVLLIIFYST